MPKTPRNLRKAALLLASLDAENARALLAQMSASQAQKLQEEVELLGPIDSDEQEQVVEEFFRIGPLVPSKQPSGIELDGRLPKHLSMSSADRERVLSRAGVATGTPPFRFLHDTSAAQLAATLAGEHPQTIAVVVSHLPSQRAAEVLSELPGQLQIDVARRLVDLDETDPDILRDVERGLENWLYDSVTSHRRRAAGLETLTNILNAADPHLKQSLLSKLSNHDRSLARRVGHTDVSLLSFGDLEGMDAASLSVVLHRAEPEWLELALAGAAEDFVERVIDLLPADDAAHLQEALAFGAPMRLSDVEEAQQALAQLASQLQASGQIVPRVRGRISVAV